jgi:H+/gluconate symporter-like permease
LKKCARVTPLDKKPLFLVMDYLLTGIVIALICLAAWLFYKRWVGRYKSAPAPEEYEDEEEETPPIQKAVAEPPAEPIPEPGTTEEK